MKFNLKSLHKIGEKIKVNPNLISYSVRYHNIDENGKNTVGYAYAIEQMIDYVGDVVTITKIVPSVIFDDLLFYKIKEDNEEFLWTDEMFDGTFDKNTNCFFNSLI